MYCRNFNTIDTHGRIRALRIVVTRWLCTHTVRFIESNEEMLRAAIQFFFSPVLETNGFFCYCWCCCCYCSQLIWAIFIAFQFCFSFCICWRSRLYETHRSRICWNAFCVLVILTLTRFNWKDNEAILSIHSFAIVLLLLPVLWVSAFKYAVHICRIWLKWCDV